MERSPVPDISPPSPTPPASATAPVDTPGPSYTAQHSPKYVHVTTRELAGVMDVVGFYTGIDGPEIDSSRDHSRVV